MPFPVRLAANVGELNAHTIVHVETHGRQAMAKHLWQIPDDLTPEQLEAEALEFDKQAAMILAARAHVAACFAVEAAVLAEIEAGTISTVRQVNAADWPSA